MDIEIKQVNFLSLVDLYVESKETKSNIDKYDAGYLDALEDVLVVLGLEKKVKEW